MKRYTRLFSLVMLFALVFAVAGAAQPTLASPESTVEANTALVEQYFGQVLGMGDTALAEEILAPDFHRIDRSLSGATLGVKGTEFLVDYYHTAFPDMRYNIDALVVEGDQVAVCWTATGTHGGFYGAAQPTGESMVWTGMSFIRVADGQIVEEMLNLENLADRFEAQKLSPSYAY